MPVWNRKRNADKTLLGRQSTSQLAYFTSSQIDFGFFPPAMPPLPPPLDFHYLLFWDIFPENLTSQLDLKILYSEKLWAHKPVNFSVEGLWLSFNVLGFIFKLSEWAGLKNIFNIRFSFHRKKTLFQVDKKTNFKTSESFVKENLMFSDQP